MSRQSLKCKDKKIDITDEALLDNPAWKYSPTTGKRSAWENGEFSK